MSGLRTTGAHAVAAAFLAPAPLSDLCEPLRAKLQFLRQWSLFRPPYSWVSVSLLNRLLQDFSCGLHREMTTDEALIPRYLHRAFCGSKLLAKASTTERASYDGVSVAVLH